MSANVLPAGLAARYSVTRTIARGAFGVVLEAVQLELKRPVALKLLHAERMDDPQIVSRFRAEARVTAQLAHPHIVRILDHDVTDAVPWIAYELLAGGTLAEAIAETAMPWQQALAAGAQVAQALAVAHAAGVLHRDIKARNVLAAGDGTWKVTDFGLAKFSTERTVRTAEGSLVGTPGYMAPELARGEAASAATDVYATGILVYELLTGAWPFNGTSGVEILRKHLNQPPPPLAARVKGLPPAAEAAVMQALAKTPAERTASAQALQAALEAALAGPASRPRATGKIKTAPSRPPPPQKSVVPLAVGVGAGAFAVAVGVGLWLSEPPPAPVPRATPTVAAPAPRGPDPVLAQAMSRIADFRDRRRAIKHSFGALIEKTADHTSFMGLSPDELVTQLATARDHFAQHRRMRDDAATFIAELRAAIKEPETAPLSDVMVLVHASSIGTVETIEVLRFEWLIGALERLQKSGGGKHLEDTLQQLKTVCYPPEVLPVLARHAELIATVLERTARGEIEPEYPWVFDTIINQSALFTSYTVCGLPPAEVVRRCEERILARLSNVTTPAASLLAALVADVWRTRSQVEPATARRRAVAATQEIAKLADLHPAAAPAYRKIAGALARFTR